jgi:hypothetical protein
MSSIINIAPYIYSSIKGPFKVAISNPVIIDEFNSLAVI